MGLSAISLFSGAGGLDLAARSEGIKTVCYVEWDRYAQAVLMSRIRDGRLDDAPIWDDVTTFDGKPWRGKVDIVFGGFPCQPHSAVGRKRGGDDNRNLWPDFLRIVRECGAAFVLGENVPGIFAHGFAFKVLADLEREGFCVCPAGISACAVGAPHPRERVFFLAHAKGFRRCGMDEDKQERCADGTTQNNFQGWAGGGRKDLLLRAMARDYSKPVPRVVRVDDGLADSVDGLRCCGNGVVPQQAAPAFQKLKAWAGL